MLNAGRATRVIPSQLGYMVTVPGGPSRAHSSHFLPVNMGRHSQLVPRHTPRPLHMSPRSSSGTVQTLPAWPNSVGLRQLNGSWCLNVSGVWPTFGIMNCRSATRFEPTGLLPAEGYGVGRFVGLLVSDIAIVGAVGLLPVGLVMMQQGHSAKALNLLQTIFPIVMMVEPLGMHFVLGGFQSSSAIIVWSLVAPVLAAQRGRAFAERLFLMVLVALIAAGILEYFDVMVAMVVPRKVQAWCWPQALMTGAVRALYGAIPSRWPWICR